MFLAYNKVHFTLFNAYVEYAELTPGTEVASRFAFNNIHRKGLDETLDRLNEDLRVLTRRDELAGVPSEYLVFTVRSANGDTFDLYFIDEDNLFLASSVEVAEDDVVAQGVKLVENWRNYR